MSEHQGRTANYTNIAKAKMPTFPITKCNRTLLLSFVRITLGAVS